MSKLNQKQLKLLREMSVEQMTNIICSLVEDNRQAKHLLISNYLSTPDESLKKAEAEYNRKIKTKRFYDYYEADAFFDESHRNIALPLEKIVSVIPEKTEAFCHNLLLTFNKLNEIADTSSGSWMVYYNGIVDIWLKSLSLQRDKGSDIISDKIMTVLKKEHFFNFNVFDRYKKELGYDVIRSLRDRLFSHSETNFAVELSLYIRDVDFIRQCFKKGKVKLPEYIIRFAKLLVDELCAEEAIFVLNSIRNDKSVDHSGLSEKWTEVFVKALIEEGEVQQAKEYCLEGFKIRCSVVFYNIYNTIEKAVDSQKLFVGMAREKGFPFVMLFLSEVKDYEKLDNEIVNAGKNEVVEILALFRGSFVRSLSGELYRHGYAYSATFLRRMLVEDSISRSQSKYYSYAASDMKKAIDYSKNITWTAVVPSTRNYFESLFIEHKRKYALWEIMQEKIDGLLVGKDSISYSL
ncbi:SpnT protein [Salmonella enterica]|uniref:SpnT protein n=1 Tax=Salmonella enterica TaxID=28901 RepID=UPI002A2B744E|nr:SpnT protein [Salmonella enterica]MDJ6543077.1 SpnT protein [Salmonella enterica]MDJ7049770.1 SpnT protein [Salmonella enterica]MDJ7339199.1 SpnT protein [Salmonella enterica]